MRTLGIMAGENGKRRMHDTSQFDRHVLSNGVVVWLQKPVIQTDYRGFLSVFFVGVGSYSDPEELKGMAHFVEHMLFRGSENKRSQDELISPITQNSGSINAKTGKYYVEYQVQINRDKLEIAAETLFDMVNAPLFDANDVVAERKIILREIREHRISGKQLMTEHAKKIMYSKKHPALFPVIGYSSHLEKITENEMRDFFIKHYHRGNANIVCGGSFSFRPDVIQILEKIFGNMRHGKINSVCEVVNLESAKGLFKFADKRYGVDSLNIGYLFPKFSMREMKLANFLNDCVSSGFGSPLFHELREKRGLVYSMSLKAASSVEGSVVALNCDLRPGKFNEAQEILLKVLGGIKEDLIIRRMREEQNKRENDFKLPVFVCEDAVDEIITHGRTYTYHEWEQLEDDIFLEDVLAWRDKLLSLEPLVIHFTTK